MLGNNPDCKLCPLWEGAINVCIGGRGSENSPVLVVGQNPGQNEDFAGEPFIGRSGKLLEDMLTDAGFNLADIRFTNAVRCVTKENEKPNTASIDACRNYLAEEIAAVKPRFIIALGEPACQSLLHKPTISKLRGKSFPLHKDFNYECEVYPTYHPAFVARRNIYRGTVVSDMRRVRTASSGPEAIDWKYWKGDRILPGREVAYDIETYGDAGEITDSMTQIAYASKDGVFVSASPPAATSIVGELQFADTLVSHNGLEFDDAKTGLRTHYDTMWLAYLMDENQPRGLESLAVKYLGVPGWKEARDNAPLGSPELAEYNARDAKYTLAFFEKSKEELGSRIDIYTKVMRPAWEVFQEASRRGIYIDQEAVEREDANLQRKGGEAMLMLEEYDIKGPFQNRAIANKLIEFGYKLNKTETNEWKVDKQTLADIDDPLSEIVLLGRSLTKMRSTYIRPYRAVAATDGRIHPRWGQLSTVVGRTTAYDPPVQTLPREYKDFLSAPEGSVFVSADYNALHFRLAAWCAQEQVILDRYTENPYWDPHRWFASILYGIPEEAVTKNQRQIAKSANFSLLYVGDGKTLQEYMARMGTIIPMQECVRIHKLWHQTFPAFKRWYEVVEAKMRRFGYVETATGRRRHFGDVKGVRGPAYQDMKREAVNFEVLGLEPDVALSGMILAARDGVAVNYFCHDSIGAECLEDEVNEVSNLITEAMTTKAKQYLSENFNVFLTVPLTVEVSVH